MLAIRCYDRFTCLGLDPWGGQQEARGDESAGPWRAANVFQELDAEREWYANFSATPPTLSYFPANGTAPPTSVIVSKLATLIRVAGGAADSPADGIQLAGFTLTHSATTFSKPYEVPSGGDWSMHRGGAVFATFARNLSVTNVHFTRLGGNAVTLSEWVRDASFVGSEFSWIGDNGILQLGSVRFDRSGDKDPYSNDLMDGADGMHPVGTSVKGCIFREIGCVPPSTMGSPAHLSGWGQNSL